MASGGIVADPHSDKRGRRGRVQSLLKRTIVGVTRAIACCKCCLTIVAIGRGLMAPLLWLLKHLPGITGAAGGS